MSRVTTPRGLGALCLALSACVDGGGASSVLADEIVEAPGATGVGFGDPSRATNGVRGGGTYAGSLDVYSLDYLERRHLVLGFSSGPVLDGPGADLVVFENGFRERERDAYFMDPIVVEVSNDGERWLAFPHDYLASDETAYEPHPAAWEGFAGVTPVAFHAEHGGADPLAPTAGGDAFDLATLVGTTDDERELARRLRAEGVRYVRLTSAALLVNPDTGVPYPRDPVSDGADIDGVVGRLAPSSP